MAPATSPSCTRFTFSPPCCSILICGNVGLLLFARAASREADLVVRTALGASRGRIVAQMFAEALVLGGVAAIVGVTAADLALRTWGIGVSRDQPGPPSLLVRSQPFPARVRRRDRADGGGRRHRRHHAGDENHARHGPSAQADHGRQRRPAVRRRMDRGDRGAGRGHGDLPCARLLGTVSIASRRGLRSRIRKRAIPRRANRTGLPGRWRRERRRRDARAQRAAGRHARRGSPEGGRAARRCWRDVRGELTDDESPAENHRDGLRPRLSDVASAKSDGGDRRSGGAVS